MDAIAIRRRNITYYIDQIATEYAASRWRRQARYVIAETLTVFEKLWSASPKSLLTVVKERYPFGEKKGHPYKVWMSEMKVVRDLVTLVDDLSKDEIEILEVARDFEKTNEARCLELVAEVGKDLYINDCVICGTKSGERCLDLDAATAHGVEIDAALEAQRQLPLFEVRDRSRDPLSLALGRPIPHLIIPHAHRFRTRLALPL